VTLTSSEAAEVLGVTVLTLRQWVHRGKLTPITPGARPLEFWAADIYDLQVAQRTPADIAWQDALWAAVDRVVAGHA
jgi:excisionase family DNA binding protein